MTEEWLRRLKAEALLIFRTEAHRLNHLAAELATGRLGPMELDYVRESPVNVTRAFHEYSAYLNTLKETE